MGQDFRDYKPNVGLPHQEYCEKQREEAIKDSEAYEVPDTQLIKDLIKEYEVFMYLGVGVITALVLVVIAAAYVPSKGKIATKCARSINGFLGFFLILLGTLFIGLGTGLQIVCEEYITKDRLGKDVTWFIDSSSTDSGSRPWIESEKFFTERCTDITPAIRRNLQPGALEEPFRNLKDALCENLSVSFISTGAILIAAICAWEIGVGYYVFRPRSETSTRIGAYHTNPVYQLLF